MSAYPAIAFQPVSSTRAKQNQLKSLRTPRKADEILPFLAEDSQKHIQLYHIERGNKLYVWGVKAERSIQWRELTPAGTVVLFREHDKVVLAGVVTGAEYNPSLAQHLWGFDDDFQLWPLVYFLGNVHRVSVPAERVSEVAGYSRNYNWQGFTVLEGWRSQSIWEQLRQELGFPVTK